MRKNLEESIVKGFGEEWAAFDQAALAGKEYELIFHRYFHIFPWQLLPENAVGFDLGCGSGRWARGVAPRVGLLHCIDASPKALAVAERNLADQANVRFHLASVEDIPLADSSMDFGYCLGVLHHVPNTMAGLRSVVTKLKSGAPFLIYLYYAFDNKPAWFRFLHRSTEAVRWLVSRCPFFLRYALTQVIAALIYWPLARCARILERAGLGIDSFPLSGYRNLSFYTMRTDALDRFGTRLEQRFTRYDIEDMMIKAGLTNIVFSEQHPFWCAVGVRR
jgi:SAM-dependent methyltransferase